MLTLKLFFQSLKYLFSDKVLFILTIIPVLFGLALYGSGFYYIMGFISAFKFGWLGNFFGLNSWFISIFTWIIKLVFGVLSYFLVNWTFVLFVSLIGCIFNEYISERIEKLANNQPVAPLKNVFTKMKTQVMFILLNEAKKLLFILLFTVLAFILGYIFAPLSFLISFILVAIQFVDYTWYRKSLTFSKCIEDIKKNLVHYSLSGALYFLLISIPIINLFVPAIATGHYSLYFNFHRKA